MTRKSTPTIVEAAEAVESALQGHPAGLQRLPLPPAHLSAPAAAWYADVAATYALESHHLRLLEGAAIAWERATAARAIIDAEGLTTADRFGQVHEHPAVLIESRAWASFARLTRECGLDLVKPAAPRLPTRWRSAS